MSEEATTTINTDVTSSLSYASPLTKDLPLLRAVSSKISARTTIHTAAQATPAVSRNRSESRGGTFAMVEHGHPPQDYAFQRPEAKPQGRTEDETNELARPAGLERYAREAKSSPAVRPPVVWCGEKAAKALEESLG